MDLTLCSLTVGLIGVAAYIIGDLDSPYRTRIDPSGLRFVVNKLESLQKKKNKRSRPGKIAPRVILQTSVLLRKYASKFKNSRSNRSKIGRAALVTPSRAGQETSSGVAWVNEETTSRISTADNAPLSPIQLLHPMSISETRQSDWHASGEAEL